ncbi:MAG: replication-associated recombination protein A [Solirubrobacteraceae bacterium]
MERLFGENEPSAGTPPTEERDASLAVAAPLATRLRPHALEEFVGQDKLLAAGSALRTAIEEGRPHSMILHGPPGSGKTTLARLLAATSDAAFEEESAVQAGRAEVRAVIERARQRLSVSGRRTILFLDEIHRFNKAQQDALLPAVEEGLITLIGATTENPYFEVNSALISRTRVYELEALSAAQVRVLLLRAVERGECGVEVEDAAVEFLAERAGGDARIALNALELACETAGPDTPVTLARAEDALQQRALLYDRQADRHYDTISAWIKATRGSDPDASLYYLAVMLEGGEDPRFIVRRMVVLASEDVGNADPQALVVATAAAHAVEHVGLPECQFALAQAAIYLSLAPKSDAAKRSIGAARGYVREQGAHAPPAHLRSSTRSDGNYDNPHRRPGRLSPQELMPDEAVGARFYEPDEAEELLRARLEEVRRARGRA